MNYIAFSDVGLINKAGGEFLGTFLLVLLGNGICANVNLNRTHGHKAGLVAIAFGWAFAILIGVLVSRVVGGSGGDPGENLLNPAFTIALMVKGMNYSAIGTADYIPIANGIIFILVQFLGAFLGGVAVWIFYKKHFDATTDQDLIRASFCTSPGIRIRRWAFLAEAFATFVLVIAALAVTTKFTNHNTETGPTLTSALIISFVVCGIVLSLGGPTGCALNPARDLAPRLAHFLLPIKNKGNSDWKYAFVPVAAPIVGAIAGVLVMPGFLYFIN